MALSLKFQGMLNQMKRQCVFSCCQEGYIYDVSGAAKGMGEILIGMPKDNTLVYPGCLRVALNSCSFEQRS